MAYIESPLGSCGGALIAPGYVLTAAQVPAAGCCMFPSGRKAHSWAALSPDAKHAQQGVCCVLQLSINLPSLLPTAPLSPQCVMFNGTIQDAAEVDVWVGGQWMVVETVLANNATAASDEANMQALIGFADFEDVDMGELSGDVALLALKKNSSATPIALPTTDVPLAGNITNQTAWQTPQEYVLSEKVTVNATCNSGFNGTFCPEEEPEAFQPLCPGDKGSPATMSLNGTLTQVGPGCSGLNGGPVWGCDCLQLSTAKLMCTAVHRAHSHAHMPLCCRSASRLAMAAMPPRLFAWPTPPPWLR